MLYNAAILLIDFLFLQLLLYHQFSACLFFSDNIILLIYSRLSLQRLICRCSSLLNEDPQHKPELTLVHFYLKSNRIWDNFLRLDYVARNEQAKT